LGNPAKKKLHDSLTMFVKIQCYFNGKIRRSNFKLKFQFDSRFLDFKANEKFFNLSLISFSLSIDDFPENMKIEIIDLQNNKIINEKYNNVELSIFIQNILTRDLS
jgi:hypothetical protein